MTNVRISVWSGPRNVSTALMYSFASRKDTKVVDEPFYAHYLVKTGVDHPGREEVIKDQENDADKVIENVILSDYAEPILFIKNMAHHFIEMDDAFLYKLKNVFLIREPREVITSLIKNIPNPVMRDTGFEMIYKMYSKIKQHGEMPFILDSKELLKNPERVLTNLCMHLDIPFDENMLSWPKGPIAEDGIWAKYWYKNVHQSTSFHPYQPKDEEVPRRHQPLLRACNHYYEMMYYESVKS